MRQTRVAIGWKRLFAKSKWQTRVVNSKEQIFVEKLKSLLKLGVVSTRYKDVYDL